MSGTGKRADQKKTLVLNLYGNKYFGKQGITSRSTKKDKRKRISLMRILNNLETYGKLNNGIWEIKLEDYKILASNEEIKERVKIYAESASEKAIEQVKKAGGEIVFED